MRDREVSDNYNPEAGTSLSLISKRMVSTTGIADRVDIFVNDRNLVGILRVVESPFATRAGKPNLAGDYVGLPPEEIHLPSPRLLGDPAAYYDYDYFDGKIAILGCVCGEVGCWPFRVRIKLREDVVIWDEFEQPHRRRWRYDELGPFVFDRMQYLSTLDRRPG